MLLTQVSDQRRRLLILAIGLVCLSIGPWASTIGTNNVTFGNRLAFQAQMGRTLSFPLPLMLGDTIDVVLQADSSPMLIEVFFLDYVVAQSPELASGDWSWTANGLANYTLRITPVTTGLLSFSYAAIRFTSQYPWATPVGITSGICLVAVAILGISRPSFNLKIPRFRWKSKTVGVALLVFAIALSIRLYPMSSMIHNDELGMGLTENWGYFAWGYLDTVRQIVTISTTDPLSYQGWSTVLNQGKPLVGVLMMSLPALVSRDSDLLLISRLVVEVSGAITATLMFLIIGRLFGRTAGILAGGLSALDPLLLNYSQSSYPDVPSVMFQLFSILFLLKFRDTERPRSAIISGLALGLAGASKSLLLIGAFVPLVYVILAKRPKPTLKVGTNLATIISISVAVFWIAWPALWVVSPSTLALAGVHLSVSPTLGAKFPQIQGTILYLGTVQSLPIYQRPIVDLLVRTSYLELAGFVVGLQVLVTRTRLPRENLGRNLLLAWFGVMLAGSELFYVNQHDLLYLVVSFVGISSVGLAFLVNKFGSSSNQEDEQSGKTTLCD